MSNNNLNQVLAKPPPMSNEPWRKSAKSIYEDMKATRSAYITRAENCASVTVPNIFPKSHSNQNTDIETPYQSVGSRAVNMLAAKFVMSLLPANQAFWKYSPPEDVLAWANKDRTGGRFALIEQLLIKLEDAPLRWLERNNIRASLYEACLQLIVAGNALIYIPPIPLDGGVRIYKLDEYVVSRDNVGNVLQIVTRDVFKYSSLPTDFRQYVLNQPMDTNAEFNQDVEVYTHVYLDESGKMFEFYVEIEGNKVKGSDGSVPMDSSHWLPVRMYKRDGEHYSRSLVEFYYGDLVTLDKLWKSIIDLAGLSAKSFILVDPASLTNVKRLQKAQNGDVIPGRAQDLSSFQHNKSADFNVVYSAAQRIEERILQAFMEPSSIQRDAERQTATEWRMMSQALDQNFGGIYSLLASEFQTPFIKSITNKLRIEASADNGLPEGVEEFTPRIVAGFDALGRGQDLEKLNYFIQMLLGFGEQGFNELNLQGLINSVALSLGLNTRDLLKSEQQKQQEMEQQLQLMQQQAAIQQQQPQEGVL